MIRILCVDDHSFIREGVKRIISDHSDIEIVGEASNANEVFEKCSDEIDIVLLDISMPGKSGMDILLELKAFYPNVKVLILSMYPEENIALRAIKTGSSGYLTKASAPDELINAIRKIYSGGRYITPELAEKLIFEFDDDKGKPPHEKLSNREFQVFCMIASGKTIKTIAAELSLTAQTISTHRARLLEKMKLLNNAALTNYAIKNRLVDL